MRWLPGVQQQAGKERELEHRERSGPQVTIADGGGFRCTGADRCECVAGAGFKFAEYDGRYRVPKLRNDYHAAVEER